MKHLNTAVLQWLSAACLLLLLNGCKKDHCQRRYTLYTPVYKTLAEVRANMKSNPPQNLTKTGKIYVYGNYIFLNEPGEGIHVIDNSQPAAPKNIAFISVPGNNDIAVLGNTLYADSYGDLVTLDITNPRSVVVKKILNGLFYSYYYNYTSLDSIRVIATWKTHDTLISCEDYRMLTDRTVYAVGNIQMDFAASSSSSTGQGGSMARMAIMNDYLYAVNYDDLSVVNISSPQQPSLTGKAGLGNWHVETIYPFKDKLFIGSNNGMYVYDVAASPEKPVKVSQFTHARSCDPVVSDGNYAWVTLRGGSFCAGNLNELEVVNVADLKNPFLQKTYSMSNPYGLSKDGNLLFICDGAAGLKMYDASDPDNIQLIKQISGLNTYDVIAAYGRALVVASDGLYQFDYSNPQNMRLLSKIGVTN